MTVFIAQPGQESQVGYLRFRFPNTRFRLFILDFVLLDSVFLYLINRNHIAPQLSLTNVVAFNYLLRSQIFVSDDRQLRAVHLILDYEPLSKGRKRYQGE